MESRRMRFLKNLGFSLLLVFAFLAAASNDAKAADDAIVTVSTSAGNIPCGVQEHCSSVSGFDNEKEYVLHEKCDVLMCISHLTLKRADGNYWSGLAFAGTVEYAMAWPQDVAGSCMKVAQSPVRGSVNVEAVRFAFPDAYTFAIGSRIFVCFGD